MAAVDISLPHLTQGRQGLSQCLLGSCCVICSSPLALISFTFWKPHGTWDEGTSPFYK